MRFSAGEMVMLLDIQFLLLDASSISVASFEPNGGRVVLAGGAMMFNWTRCQERRDRFQVDQDTVGVFMSADFVEAVRNNQGMSMGEYLPQHRCQTYLRSCPSFYWQR